MTAEHVTGPRTASSTGAASARCGTVQQSIASSCTSCPTLPVQVAELIAQGKLRAKIEKVLPLEEAAAAHELSQGGHVCGKLVLQVADLS